MSVRVRVKVEELDSKRRRRLFELNNRSRSSSLVIEDSKRPILDASSDVLSRSSDDSKRRRLNVPRDQRDNKRRVNVLQHLGSNNNGNSHRCARILVR